jgi:hypothetical protein
MFSVSSVLTAVVGVFVGAIVGVKCTVLILIPVLCVELMVVAAFAIHEHIALQMAAVIAFGLDACTCAGYAGTAVIIPWVLDWIKRWDR